jgi:enterochelin esterase family protein
VVAALALLVAFAPSVSARGRVISPKVRRDGWVTFRYEDPDATLVQLYGEWGRNEWGAMCYSLETFSWPILDMTMDADGVWSYTIQLEPNFYNYHFIVDGVAVPDPLNPAWHPDVINSQVYVPWPRL